MPTVWKYCLSQFIKIFFLTLCGFITLLLVMRLGDIAHFAAQSNEWSTVALFMLYQIPYILPLAMPIAALTAAFITMRQLCDSSEMTALRAGTLSINNIHTPILCAALLLSGVNFMLASELTPYSRMQTRKLVHKTTTRNPLFLLKKSKYVRLSDTSIDLSIVKANKHAKNLTFITFNKSADRLSAVFAKDLKVKNGQLKIENLTQLAYLPSDNFDHLLIENQQETDLPAENLSLFLRNPSVRIAYDSLPWRQMRLKAVSDIGNKRYQNAFLYECVRRTSYGMSPLTFSLIGLSFGLQIGRNRRKRALVLATCLTALLLASVLVGKSFETKPILAALCYYLPHPIAWILAWRYKNLKEQGVE
ncbi:MAG: LptF/LptG family permease [Chlamydiales bacterium]|nr:LptF/LptG family permease [Chlamydiales bacterium]